jgi:hypothetical protein
MPDMTQAVPGLLAQVHPAHTHSHDIMACVNELEYRVSSLEQAIVGLVGGGEQKLNAKPDQALQAENVLVRQGYGVPQTNEGAPARQQDARTAFGGQITHDVQNDPAHPTDVRRAPREGA